MLSIMIADDHFVVRQGLERILLKEFPSATIDQVGDAEEMIKRVMKSKYDLIISDLSMPGLNGLEAIRQIKDNFPDIPILILSIHPEEHYAVRVLKAGASGYLTKSLAPEELITAVHRVLLGRKYITPSIAERLSDHLQDDNKKMQHEQLSDREFEVFKLLAEGSSITEIASKLSVSANTISTYRSRILSKMSLRTNAEITKYAIANKLL
jgi:two-component system invasion response regulator UvrY